MNQQTRRKDDRDYTTKEQKEETMKKKKTEDQRNVYITQGIQQAPSRTEAHLDTPQQKHERKFQREKFESIKKKKKLLTYIQESPNKIKS